LTTLEGVSAGLTGNALQREQSELEIFMETIAFSYLDDELIDELWMIEKRESVPTF
jgi:hypothetical protein